MLRVNAMFTHLGVSCWSVYVCSALSKVPSRRSAGIVHSSNTRLPVLSKCFKRLLMQFRWLLMSCRRGVKCLGKIRNSTERIPGDPCLASLTSLASTASTTDEYHKSTSFGIHVTPSSIRLCELSDIRIEPAIEFSLSPVEGAAASDTLTSKSKTWCTLTFHS